MDEVSLRAVLDADPRPSLIIDLHDKSGTSHLKPAYTNTGFKAHPRAFKLLTSNDADAIRLRSWANRSPSNLSLNLTGSHVFRGPDGSSWFSYTVSDRWRILQSIGDVATIFHPPEDIATPPADSMHHRLVRPQHEPSSADLIHSQLGLSDDAIDSIAGLRQHLDVVISFDWAATSMGPIASWPEGLVEMVHMILLHPLPQCLFLGDDHLLLYNVPYAGFSGARHPSIMGADLWSAWPEGRDINLSALTSMDAGGRPFVINDFEIPLNRNGYLEEVHLKWSTCPLKGPLRAYLCTAAEETSAKITARRKAMLNKISDACRGMRDMVPFWCAVLKTLGTNTKDFPFAFVYTKVMGKESTYALEGVLDADDPSAVLPVTLDLTTDGHCLVQAMKLAEEDPGPVAISEATLTLPASITSLSQSRGFGDRCTKGLICPIRRAGDNYLLGMVFIGQNTRKVVQPDDQAFVRFMTRCLSDLATNTSNAQDTDRIAKQTASQHQTLIQALETSNLEVTNMSEKFHYIVKTMEMVDVGIFEYDMAGRLVQANEAFFKLSGHTRGIETKDSMWKDCIHEADLAMTERNWELVSSGGTANFNFRYKNPPSYAQPGDLQYAADGWWVTAAVVPVVDSKTGMVKRVSGCITDIMPVKKAQLEADRRAEALERLRESEQKFHRFAQHAPCPIFMFDDERKLVFCNDAYRELVEVGPDEDFGPADWVKVLAEEDAPRVCKIWEDANIAKSSMTMTCRLKRQWNGPDGATGPSWIMASAFPEKRSDGSIRAWIGVAVDVSQFKWAEKVQQDRVQEAFEAKQSQEAFIDMTSHEIRNPLGAVVQCADSILTSLLDLNAIIADESTTHFDGSRQRLAEIYDSALDAVNTIISCSTHQRRIVDDVLTFSKTQSNLLKIVPSLVRPAAILGDIRNMFEADARKAGISLVVQQEADARAMADAVMLDTGRLMQVIINLVTNAIKFTREEQVRTVTVTMGATVSKPSLDQMPVDFVPNSAKQPAQQHDSEWGTGQPLYLFFLVQDTGCGLSPEEKSKIFARFSQGSPRTHTKYGGSGLGLFISRELVELQCGEIGFSSQAGVGSTFGFFVKARAADEAIRQSSLGLALSRDVAIRQNVTSGSSSRSNSIQQRSYTILVVEDNIVNQTVLSKQLRRLGHAVHVANHGEDALRVIRETSAWRDVEDPLESPSKSSMLEFSPGDDADQDSARQDNRVDIDVILMDVEMPIMDGLTCAARIRELQARGSIARHLPIIAVSANARSEQVGQALECGMDDAIAKPFRVADLLPKIERLVGG